jgi:hypothetical protein
MFEVVLEAHMDALRRPDPAGIALACLLDAVETHVREEARSLAVYRRMLAQAQDPEIHFVMDMLVRDEARHHRLLQQMARSLRSQLAWETERGGSAADMKGIAVDEVRALALEEQHGADQLRALAARQRAGEGDFASLLLQSMATDSEKHALLLSFVARHLTLAS